MKDGCRTTDKIVTVMGKGFNEGLSPRFNMKLELYDSVGNIKEVRNVHNTVTTVGKNGIADQLLASPTVAKPGWMELGEGTPSTTLLGNYVIGSRVALTSKLRTDNVVTMVGDWGAAVGTGAITEAGIFNIATENTAAMFCSSVFSVVNKGAGDVLKITWTITVA
jgi:hypothetical protein